MVVESLSNAHRRVIAAARGCLARIIHDSTSFFHLCAMHTRRLPLLIN